MLICSRLVYLYRDGQLHAFPNGHTFLAMGFDFDNIKVIADDVLALYPIGDPLVSQ